MIFHNLKNVFNFFKFFPEILCDNLGKMDFIFIFRNDILQSGKKWFQVFT